MTKNATQSRAGRHRPNVDSVKKFDCTTQKDYQYRAPAIRKLVNAVEVPEVPVQNAAGHAGSLNTDNYQPADDMDFPDDFLLELQNSVDPPASNHGNQVEAPVTLTSTTPLQIGSKSVSPTKKRSNSSTINETEDDAKSTVKREKIDKTILMEKFVKAYQHEVIEIFKAQPRRTGNDVLTCPRTPGKKSIWCTSEEQKGQYNLPAGIQGEQSKQKQSFITRLHDFSISGATLGLSGNSLVRFEDPRDCAEVIQKQEEWFERKRRL